MVLFVEVRNVSTHEIRIDYPNLGTSYDFTAVDEATGQPVPKQAIAVLPGHDIYDLFGANSPLEPGQSWLQQVVISDYFNFGQPGTYDIHVAFSRFVLPRRHRPFTVTSNTVVLHITE